MTAPALSRTPRQTMRRARGWIVLVAILVIGAGLAAAVQLSLASTSTDPMSASNPAQQGGRALARVLSQHGVDVRQPARVLEVIFEGDRAVGVKVQKEGGGSEEVRAKVVVDASGQSGMRPCTRWSRRMPARLALPTCAAPTRLKLLTLAACRVAR